MASPAMPISPEASRWLGLRSYEESDSALFFGRDEDSEKLLRMVRREVLTVVFAPSGTGKTSLLKAGLFPKLRNSGFLPVWIRLDHSGGVSNHGRYIRDQLESAAKSNNLEISSIVAAQVDQGEETFWEYMHRVEFWDKNNELVTPVIVIDQFEEVFTIGRDCSETKTFIPELADIVEKRIPTRLRERLQKSKQRLSVPTDVQAFRFVLSLRQDFVARLDDLRKAIPAAMRNRYPLHQMTGEQALQAVLGPGEGIVTEDVARRIVEIVGGTATSEPCDAPRALDDVSVEPNHLSLVCHELDQSRIQEGSSRITVERLKEQSQGILRRFYLESFTGLDSSAQIFVEDDLLTATGYRKSQPLDDARIRGLSDSSLRQLVDRHVLRLDDRPNISHVELTHDILTGVVLESRDRRHQDEEKARLRSERRKERKRRQTYSVVCAVLMTFLCGAIFLALRANKAEKVAARNAVAAEQLLSFMTNDLYDRLRPIGRLDLLQQVAMKAQEHLEGAEVNALTPQSRLAQARARNRVGNVLLLRGFLKDATESQRRAIALLSGDEGANQAAQNDLVGFQIDLAESLGRWDDPSRALELLAELKVDETPSDALTQTLLARKHLVTGRIQSRLGWVSEAEKSLKKGKGFCKQTIDGAPTRKLVRDSATSRMAEFHMELARLNSRRTDYPEAFSLIRGALADVRKLNKNSGENMEWRLQEVRLLLALGELHLNVGDTVGARDKFVPALITTQQELADNSRFEVSRNEVPVGTAENPEWRRLVVRLHRSLGRISHLESSSAGNAAGGATEAKEAGEPPSVWEEHFRKAVKEAAKLPDNSISHLLRTEIISEYGSRLAGQDKFTEQFQIAREIFSQQLNIDKTSNPTILFAFAEHCKTASVLMDESKSRVETSWFADAQSTLKRVNNIVPDWASVHTCRAELLEKHSEWLRQNGRISEAVELRRYALNDRVAVYEIDNSVAEGTRLLATAHWQLGDISQWATPLNDTTKKNIDHFRTSQRLFESLNTNGNWWVEDKLNAAQSLYHAGVLLKEIGEEAESNASLRQASEMGFEKATEALIAATADQEAESIMVLKARQQRQRRTELLIPCVLQDQLVKEAAESVPRQVLAPVVITGPAEGIDFKDSALALEFQRLKTMYDLKVADDIRRELKHSWRYLNKDSSVAASLAEFSQYGAAEDLADLSSGSDDSIRLEGPAAGRTLIGKKCMFRWSYQGSQRDRWKFDLQISRDSEFTNLILSKPVEGTSYQFSFNSEKDELNQTLYWRVRSKRADGSIESGLSTEPWSRTGEFEIYENLVKRIELTKSLRIGLFEFDGDLLEWEPGTTKWAGFNGELITSVREHLSQEILKNPEGLEIKASAYSWNGMFDAASRAEVDCAISVITRTKDRERKFGIRFSEPYYETQFALVSHSSNPVKSIEELRERGNTVLVNKDFRGEIAAKMLVGAKNEIKPNSYQRVGLLLDEVLRDGEKVKEEGEKAMAAITDYAFVHRHLNRKCPENKDKAAHEKDMTREREGLHIVELHEIDYQNAMSGATGEQRAKIEEMSEDFGGAEFEQYAVAVSPEATKLLGEINEAILQFRMTKADDACKKTQIPPAARLYDGDQRPEEELRLATVMPRSPKQLNRTKYVIGDKIKFELYPVQTGSQYFHLQLSESANFSPVDTVKTGWAIEEEFVFAPSEDGEDVISEGPLFWRAKATPGKVDLYPNQGWCKPARFEYYRSFLSRIKITRKIRVAVNLSNGQSVFRNDAGDYDGFDIRLMNMLAKDLAEKLKVESLELTPVEVAEFNELFESFESNNVDMAVSGITATDGRKEEYNIEFSDPYCRTCQAAVWMRDSGFKTPTDLKGHYFIVSGPTRAFEFAKAFSPKKKITQVQSSDRMARWGAAPKGYLLEQLIDGKAEAVIMDYPAAVNARLQQANPDDFVIVPLRKGTLPKDVQISIDKKYPNDSDSDFDSTVDKYAIALPTGQEDLFNKVNESINKWKTAENRPLREIFSHYQPTSGEEVFELD